MSVRRILAAAGCVAVLSLAALTHADAAKDKTVSITVRAGKSDSPTYALARQFSAALALASNGGFALDVKESHGSVENVMDAPKSRPNTIFTASASVIRQARRGAKPFKRNPGYYDIRALFPIPFQTLHWVVRQDSGIHALSALAGHSVVAGSKGSVSESLTVAALQTLGIERKVQLIDIDIGGAPAAILGKKISGLALAGSFPVPMIAQLAKATPIRLLGLKPATITKLLAGDDNLVRQVIPKGTYPGVNEDIDTIAVPAGTYTTVRMSNAVAYALTKAFWSQVPALTKRNPAWRAMVADTLPALGIRLHPGALRYYNEAGIPVPKALR